MSGISAQAVTVDYVTADSSALAGTDYAATSGTLSIPVDSTSGVITVPITDDLISEGDEVFKMLLSGASGATLFDSLGLGTILDNEAAPTLSIADASANEDAGTINFTVTMSGISAQTVTVDFATADSSAIAGSDYTNTTGTLTIPMDSTSGVITVPITDDAISEGSEVFKMLLSNATGATISDSLGLGTILDNEAAPVLSIADASANEDAGTMAFTVTMSGISAQAVTVDYATADSSAIADSDYTAASGTLTIPMDSTSGVITVPITDDAVSEGSEVFKMLLSNATGATISDSLGLGTIIDNEAAPVLSIADASANEDTGTIDFTVTMSGISAQAVTVDYASADSSALAGSDYTATSGTLTIPADSTSGIITVPITDDAVSEDSEVFKMLLSGPSGASLTDSLGLGTIIDNEAAPTLSIADASANEDAGTIDFTVTMSGISAQVVTVDYATADSSAIAGADYTATLGTLTIPVDSTSGVITVPIPDDLISEGSEVFKLLLSNASGATITDSLGLGTIIDNEAAPTLSIADASANEDAGTMAFTVTMSGISAQTVTVDFATADSSAIAGSDYANTTGTLTIPMDSTSGIITVPITDDAISEGSEIFELLLTGPTNATLLDSLALGTIIDDEAAPVLSIADTSANEDAGTIDFIVTMSGISAQAVTVDYATADSSALAGSDYANSSGTLTIPVDSTSGIITVPLTDDAISEGSEVFKLLLTGPTNATLLDSLGLGMILDNEVDPVLSIADASANEDAGTVAFTVSMSGVSAQAITVDYATSDSTALAGSDYTAASGTLTIPADSTSGVIMVPITDDAISEGSEIFELLLSGPVAATFADSLGLGTIIDNEAAPVLTIADTSANESAGTIDFTVTMSGISGQTVTVDYATADSTALAGSDYTATAGTLTIPADSTSGTITVPITDDAISEGNEIVKLQLSNSVAATLLDSLVLGKIADNDALPTLSIDDATADEAADTLTFTISLSAVSGQLVSVNYTTADSSAIAGADYTAISGSLTIPTDSISGIIKIPITDDSLSESDEVFKLQLSSPMGATFADSLALGTIADNDGQPGLSVNDASVNESADTLFFTVSLSSISGQTISVDYTTSDSTALAGSDYTATAGTLNIPADSISGMIGIPIADDSLSESSEIFKLQLSNAIGAIVSDSLGLGTITDNDTILTLSINDVSADEAADTLIFAVSLSSPAIQTVTVNYTTADSTALGGSDYSPTAGTMAIPVDSVSGQIRIPITDDALSEASEIFKLQLSGAVGAALADSLGLGTITDNDALPILSIADTTANEDAGTLDFLVSLSSISGQTISVDYTTADSTALAGSDYTATTGTLNILADSISGVISIPIADDSLSESSEIFKLQLSNAIGATISDSLGLATITDDDGAGPVTISFQDGVNGYSGTRDAVLKAQSPTTNYGTGVENELDGSPDEATLLYWDVTAIPAGSTIESVDITFNTTNTSGATYEVYDIKRPWIENEATWSEFATGQSWSIAGADGSLDRGSTVLGAITAPSTGSTTISLNTEGVAVVQAWVDDPASNHGLISQDYINHSNGLDFSAREVSNATSRPKLTVAYSEGSVPTLSIDNVTVTEGNSGAVDAVFNVTLFPASSEIVTVDYSTSDGSATTADNDYVAVSGQVSFQAGETNQTITVHVNGDVIQEEDESFFVDLSNAVNAPLAINQGTGTITGDDGPSSVVISFQDGVNGYSGTRDAVLKGNSPTTNYGSGIENELDGSPDESTLLFWDVTAIPVGSTIESVDITFNTTNQSKATYELYELKRPWVENEVTWNEYASGLSWEAAGAGGFLDRGSTDLGAIVAPMTGETTISLNADGIAVVQGWISDPSSNHGLISQDYINHSNGLDFSSREVTDPALRPKLTITYSNTPPTGKMAAAALADFAPEPLPKTLELSPNYPNPFNLQTTIEYALPEEAHVRLEVYNILGQRVRVLIDDVQNAGFKRATWDGRDQSGQESSSGVYFARLIVGQQSFVNTMTLRH